MVKYGFFMERIGMTNGELSDGLVLKLFLNDR